MSTEHRLADAVLGSLDPIIDRDPVVLNRRAEALLHFSRVAEDGGHHALADSLRRRATQHAALVLKGGDR